jgi:hypothetical protein
MAISNEDNFEKYSPAIATTVFDWGIYYFADTDIAVAVEDTAGDVTHLVLNDPSDGFSVQATNGDRRQGATITMTETYDLGDLITISRVVPLTQEYDLKAGAEINPTSLNKAFDRTVAQSQQIQDDGARHLVHPITDPVGLSYTTPTASARAGLVAGWDESGNVTAVSVATGSSPVAGVNTSTGLSLSVGGVISGEVDNTSLEFDGNGDFSIKDLGVDTAQLAADAVETAKIVDDNVTYAKIQNVSATAKLLGRTTAGAGVIEEVTIDADLTSVSASDDTVPSAKATVAYVDAHGLVQTYYEEFDTQYATSLRDPIPDSSTPLVTEGQEIATTSFTPSAISNKIRVSYDATVTGTTNSSVPVLAVFAGSTCIGATHWTQSQYGNSPVPFVCEHVTSVDTAVTYSVRVSVNAGTLYINRSHVSTATLGGLMTAKLTITEFKQ